jgi:glucose-1-phosphate thymidylyltransferase
MSLKNQRQNDSGELVGVIPAAGTAKRLGQLPCSKELFPVGFHKMRDGYQMQPKAVSHYLLERMQMSGVTKAFFILRKGKWDILTYYADGKILNMHIAYLLMNLPFGVPFTIDQAYPFLKDTIVVFGFPDILFEPKDAFDQLLGRQMDSNADVVLGLYPAHAPHKADMVETDANGRIQRIEIKPTSTALSYAWIIAVWKFTFTEFMHRHLEIYSELDPPEKELFLGDVFQAAIDDALQIESVIFQNSRFQDIGTSEDLIKAVSQPDFS